MTSSQGACKRSTAVARMFRAAVWLGLPGLAQSANANTATEHMLNPAGPAAAQIAAVWWEMLVVYGAVFIITMVFLVLAMASRRKESIFGTKFVVVAGIVIPAVILVVMLLSTIHTTVELGRQEADFRVKVTSHHWWFEVDYLDHGIIDANEINIPAGVVVQFILQSHAVVHSFWVPRLGGKRDMLPDHPTELFLKSDIPGNFRGTCTEYCAGPHALMAFRLIAHDPEDFQRWLARSSRTPETPTDPRLVHGRDVFVNEGCSACHAIKGVSDSTTGPDLTLLGSRSTLGAGTIAHTQGGLSGWIANPEVIKPGNLMPRSYLRSEDLHALTDYLRSLK